MLNSDDPYLDGRARRRTCDYLYFPEFPATWNSEAWTTDFDHKAEVLQRAWWITARDVGLTFRGEPMPVELSGMGLLGDYVGRRDGWEWPSSEKDSKGSTNG